MTMIVRSEMLGEIETKEKHGEKYKFLRLFGSPMYAIAEHRSRIPWLYPWPARIPDRNSCDPTWSNSKILQDTPRSVLYESCISSTRLVHIVGVNAFLQQLFRSQQQFPTEADAQVGAVSRLLVLLWGHVMSFNASKVLPVHHTYRCINETVYVYIYIYAVYILCYCK